MFKKILIILAVTCVAICEVNITHFVPNELQAVPTNKSELMFVLWNAFLANFIKLDWNTTFGYVANTSVEVAIIVRTNEAVQLGKWTVGRKRPVYSSYPNEEIIAHHPEDLGNGLYLFKLSIPQPGHTFYNNNVTFEAIINETHRTNHSFIIPFVFSMDGIVATSQALFCIFLLSIVLIVLKMATFLGYKYFLFVPLDWPLRLGILLSCVLTTVGFWYLLHKLVVFALGPSVVIVNVMNITIASLLCFSIIPPNLIHIPLGFIHIIQHWFKPICNLCIFYVTLITFTVFLTTTVNIFSINSCVAKEASVLFRGAKSFMSQGVEGVVQDMKHLFNEELRVNEDFELPKDDLFKSFVEMLGASGETPLDELKQLGRNYTKMQQDKCLGVFADLVNQCSDSRKDLVTNCKEKFHETLRNNTARIVSFTIRKFTSLENLCEVAGEPMNCTKVASIIESKGKEACKEHIGSLQETLQLLSQAYKKTKFVSTTFKDVKQYVNLENFESLKLQIPSFAHITNIPTDMSLGIVLGFFPLLLFLFVFYVLFQVIRENAHYINLFIKGKNINDTPIGRKFRMYDIKQAAMRQRPKFIFCIENFLKFERNNLPNVNFYLILYVMFLWWSLQYTSLIAYEVNKHFLNMDTSLIHVENTLEVSVTGKGKAIEEFQEITDKLNNQSKRYDIDLCKCIIEPPVVPHALFIWILFFFLIGCLESKLQVFMYLKPRITGIFFPAAAEMNMERCYHIAELKITQIYKTWLKKLQKMPHVKGDIGNIGYFRYLLAILHGKYNCTICKRLLLNVNGNNCPKYPRSDFLLCDLCWILLGEECPICAFERKGA